jgi:rhamnulokinase
LESLALKYRWVISALEGLAGHSLNTVRIVGGGSRNHLLNQLTADACGRPVIAGPVEATALGNMMVQAIARGHISSIAEGRRAVAASARQQTYEPRESAAWQETWARFQGLLP